MYSNLFKNEVISKSLELTNNMKNLKDLHDLKTNEKDLVMINKLISYITKYELFLNNKNEVKNDKKDKKNNNNNNTF
jgi:hypothetical protein